MLFIFEEAQTHRGSCVGDGTRLTEIAKDARAQLAGIELDSDRAAAALGTGIATSTAAPLPVGC
jgi:hypothetical protein